MVRVAVSQLCGYELWHYHRYDVPASNMSRESLYVAVPGCTMHSRVLPVWEVAAQTAGTHGIAGTHGTWLVLQAIEDEEEQAGVRFGTTSAVVLGDSGGECAAKCGECRW